jgi:glucose/arabinose dehydrogenase/mono/diheme cytochrome c family protein
MRKKLLIVITVVLLQICFFCNCNTAPSNSTSISTDPKVIASGEALFNQACSGCHNFRQDGIGPHLRGLTNKVSADWIHRFIADPEQILSSDDERGKQLFARYKTVMPSFNQLTEEEVNSIIAYLHTHQLSAKQVAEERNAILNPIADTIKFSGIVVNLEPLAQLPSSSDSGKKPLARITKVGLQPGSENLFILDLRGRLYMQQGKNFKVYMDMAELKPKFIHKPGLGTGFGSFAFHPAFKKNGLLYTTHTEPAGAARADFSYEDSIKVTLQWVLTEWKIPNPGSDSFSGTARELMRVNMVTGQHGVQEITFNPYSKNSYPDYNHLYIGIGDGASVENGYPFLTQSLQRIWGTVLRINPEGRNSANRQYGIPADNPFAQHTDSKTVREIYAYGFRNPHRITWSKSGNMLVSNIGHGNIESINLILPGQNYGWPIREGRFVVNPSGDLNKVYALPANDSTYKFSYPVVEYDHDEGKAISGGYEYLGNAIPELKGKLLFGDIPLGRLFYVDVNDIKPGKQAEIEEWRISISDTLRTLEQLCSDRRVDLHFGRDSHGELYILTKADGRVYKLQSLRTQSSKSQ